MKIRLEVLEKRRYELGMSEHDFCLNAKVNLGFFTSMRKGRLPHACTIKRLADYMGVKPNDLIDWEKNP